MTIGRTSIQKATNCCGFRLLGSVVVLLASGCGNTELEVRGDNNRAIGEKLTLSVMQGETALQSGIQLRDASGALYGKAQLGLNITNDKEAQLTIPSGVVAGKAFVQLPDDSGTTPLQVELNLHRMLIGATASGDIELVPLPPSTLPTQKLTGVGDVVAFSMMPQADAAWVLTKDRLRLIGVGRKLVDRNITINIAGALKVDSFVSGAVVVTSAALVRVIVDGKNHYEVLLALPAIQDVAVAQDGSRAFVLHHCDTEVGVKAGSDCVTEVLLDGDKLVAGRTKRLDDKPSASLIETYRDASGNITMVVADGPVIYGLSWEATGEPTMSQLRWDGAVSPMAVAHGPSQLGELFVVADELGKRLWVVGFDKNSVKHLHRIALPETPVAIAYGWQADLYVLMGTQISQVRTSVSEPKLVPVGLKGNPAFGRIAVQF